MKKICLLIGILLVLVSVSVFSVYARLAKGEDEVLDIARKEAGLDKSSEEITVAGRSDGQDNCLYWFVAGEKYLPIEFKVEDGDIYEFIHTYTPYERGLDIRTCEWSDGFSFLINNPDCKYIVITYGDAAPQKIEVTSIPFVYDTALTPNEYHFTDVEGNVLPS